MVMGMAEHCNNRGNALVMGVKSAVLPWEWGWHIRCYPGNEDDHLRQYCRNMAL